MRDTIDWYFDEVSQRRLPTRKEERDGFTAYSQLRQAREAEINPVRARELTEKMSRLAAKLAEGYLRFVIGKARERTKDPQLLVDLIGAGNVGLMIAVSRFNAIQYSNHFLTYASHWVRVEMDKVQQKRTVVHISVHERKQALARGETPVDPPLTPDDSVQLTSPSDTERESRPHGLVAMKCLQAASLTRRERVVLTFALGLRGDGLELSELSLVLYHLDGSVFLPEELEAVYAEGLRKLQAWARAQQDPSLLRGELSE